MEEISNVRRSLRIYERSQRNERDEIENKQSEQYGSDVDTSLYADSEKNDTEEQKVAPIEHDENTPSRSELDRIMSTLRDEMAEMSRHHVNDMMQKVQQSLEQLWSFTKNVEERINSSERSAKRFERHLEVTVAQATQRIEDSVAERQRQVEERLNTLGNEVSERIELQSRGLTREIEDLRRQVEKVQKNQSVRPIASSVPNHQPFAARQPVLQTPMTSATSTSIRPGAFSMRQATDISDDFTGIEEFGEDLFATPEGRRDDFDRRNSLGGGSIFNAILAPVEASNTYMISSVTRESYSQVVLRDITLDSVGPFMNHYLNIKRKHPGQAWMIVDFCSEYTKQELTVLADTYELPGAALGLGGAFALTDRQVLFLILEKLKARSMDDFVTRLQNMRFLEEETDLDFTKQYNYEKLFRAALSFRFRFVMRVQLLGSRAKAEHIPPLHKMGQTPGLLTFFFNAWPAGTGKSLFSRHFTPEMRAQSDLKSFFKLFFAKLNTYRDVKQGYDDLGSVLSSQQRDREGEVVPGRQREDKAYVKRESYTNLSYLRTASTGGPQARAQRSQSTQTTRIRNDKKIWTPERERRDFRSKMLHHTRVSEEDMESRTAR